MHINNIHFINPARNINKNGQEKFSKIQTLEHFINFGIYSIIQELEDNNISSSFHDFQYGYLPAILQIKLEECSSNLVGISIISAFNASSANCILEDVKKFNKNNITVIGGQHYIGKLKTKPLNCFQKLTLLSPVKAK